MKKPDKKLIILFAVIFVLAGAFIVDRVFFKKSRNSEQTSETNKINGFEDSLDIDIKSGKPKRTNLYKQQHDSILRLQNNKRNISDDDDLFDEEITSDDTVVQVKQEAKNPPVTEVKKDVPKANVVYKKEVVKTKPEPVVAPSPKKVRSYPASGSASNMVQSQVNSKPVEKASEIEMSVKAILYNDQTVFSGGPLYFRLMYDLKLENGEIVPKGAFVTGITMFNQQRCTVTLSSVKARNGVLYPVNLVAFDAHDGTEGIYIPGGTGQDASKSVASDAASSVVQSAASKLGLGVVSGSLSSAGRNKINEQSILFSAGHEVIFKKKL